MQSTDYRVDLTDTRSKSFAPDILNQEPRRPSVAIVSCSGVASTAHLPVICACLAGPTHMHSAIDGCTELVWMHVGAATNPLYVPVRHSCLTGTPMPGALSIWVAKEMTLQGKHRVGAMTLKYCRRIHERRKQRAMPRHQTAQTPRNE